MIKLTDDRLFIDGFNDILTIQNEELVFLYTKYDIKIEGEALQVISFSKSEMIIKGKITGVMFIYKDGK